jgi:mannose-6-phosphate isomerase
VRRITPHPKETVWGSTNTAPWFPNAAGQQIGEVWFPSDRLLLKFLFTQENLSVQVHPGDRYAAKHHNGSPGKTEMWHILRAEPDARIAVGLNRVVSKDELARAAEDGSIEKMMQWVPVQPGENYFIPAGTIHAIGAGIALFEIQQKSEITYRLYDWGRGRELHLQHALEVADLTPFDGRRELPVQCEYFRTEPGCRVIDGPAVLAVIEGSGTAGGNHLIAGDVVEVVGRVALQGNLKTLCIR